MSPSPHGAEYCFAIVAANRSAQVEILDKSENGISARMGETLLQEFAIPFLFLLSRVIADSLSCTLKNIATFTTRVPNAICLAMVSSN